MKKYKIRCIYGGIYIYECDNKSQARECFECENGFYSFDKFEEVEK